MTRLKLSSSSLAIALLLYLLSYTCTSFAYGSLDAQWDAASSSVTVDDAGWLPSIELDSMGSMNSLGRIHTMTDRELFDYQTTMTGLPPVKPEPPTDAGLYLTCEPPPVIYYCRPTEIPGVNVFLHPKDDVNTLNNLGQVTLIMDGRHGTISFANTDGKNNMKDKDTPIHCGML